MNRTSKAAIYGLLIALVVCGSFGGYQLYRRHPLSSDPKRTLTPQQTTEKKTITDETGNAAHKRLMHQEDEFHKAQQLANDLLELKNAHLENDIARLEGKRQNRTKVALAEAKVNAAQEAGVTTSWYGLVDLSAKGSMGESLMVMTLFMDCGVAMEQKHNAAFPNEKWGSTESVRDQIGGKPSPERLQVAKACAEDGNLAGAIKAFMRTHDPY